MQVEETGVLFRKWRDASEVIALFPAIPADLFGMYTLSYERLGQHGGADFHLVVGATRPATHAEASSLAEELDRIGYTLRPIKRASRKVHEARRAEARRIRLQHK